MNRKKQLDPVWILIIIYIAAIYMMLMSSCNPVKRVLKDKNKLDQVAEVVVRSGYCANDTMIVSKSDTLYSFDTITDTQLETFVRNDTIFKTQFKNRVVTKTVTIKDTIQKVVVDNAKINLLYADLAKINNKLVDAKEQSRKRLHWIVLFIIVISGYIVLKLYYRK